MGRNAWATPTKSPIIEIIEICELLETKKLNNVFEN
jgi:hypothetical protein